MSAQSVILPCECGGTYFRRVRPCSGKWIETLVLKDGALSIEESTTDGVCLSAEPKFIRCYDCGKRRPNPKEVEIL